MKNKRLYLVIFAISLFTHVEALKAQNRLEQAKAEYKDVSWVFMDASEYDKCYQLIVSQKECIISASSEKEYDQLENSMLAQDKNCPKLVGYTHPAMQKEQTSALELLVYTDKGNRFARPFVAPRNVAKCGDINILAIDFKDNEYFRNYYKDVIKKVDVIYVVVQPTSAVLAKKQTEIAKAVSDAYQKTTSEPKVNSNASAFTKSLNKLIECYPDFSSVKGDLIPEKNSAFAHNTFASKVSLEGSISTVVWANSEHFDVAYADFGGYKDPAKAKEVYQNLVKQVSESSKCCCNFVMNVTGGTTAWRAVACEEEGKFKNFVMEAVHSEKLFYEENVGFYKLQIVYLKIYPLK
ncbi:MAG: hypothetical protein V4608_04340 [Bacteroidota bacterium]